MNFEHGHPVIQHHRTVSTTPDALGNDTYNETDETITGVGIMPTDGNDTSTNEDTQTGDRVTEGRTLLMPARSRVSALDQFTIDDGDRWDVTGNPAGPVSPFTGWAPGVPVTIVRVSG